MSGVGQVSPPAGKTGSTGAGLAGLKSGGAGQALEGLKGLGDRIRTMVRSMLDGVLGGLRGGGATTGAKAGVAALGAPSKAPAQTAAAAPVTMTSALPAQTAPVSAPAPATAPTRAAEPAAVPAPAPVAASPLPKAGLSAADAALLDTAYATAMKTEEGRQVLANLGSLDLKIQVVDSIGGSVIGRYQGEQGKGGTITLKRSQLERSPEAAAALLAHEVRHAIAGGDEAAAEETERKVLEGLGKTYVMD
ncbi:MAG: hypothetical protein JWO69_11 [Thermoleophilia bacterium]|nr:hypothetical protein [Thermoleophilia bacterium]